MANIGGFMGTARKKGSYNLGATGFEPVSLRSRMRRPQRNVLTTALGTPSTTYEDQNVRQQDYSSMTDGRDKQSDDSEEVCGGGLHLPCGSILKRS